MNLRHTLIFAAVLISGCAYSPPSTTYDATRHPVHLVGLIGGSFPTRAVADQTETARVDLVGSVAVVNDSAHVARANANSDRFTAALRSIGYDPEVALRRSLQRHLAEVGIQTVTLDHIERRRRVGLSREIIEYSGESAGADAFLDVTFTQWGFASKRDESTLRPYMLFVVRLNSPDGRQSYMSEVIQYNDINFAGFQTAIINGDPGMQFSSVDELVAHATEASQYLDAAIDDIAREIAGRLR